MSYIKREPLLQIAKELQGSAFSSPLIVKAIEDAPVEDVVEVVRCKDCVWYNIVNECCTNTRGLFLTTPDRYCSYGERREK